jgi:hypothetical protein
MNRRARNRSRRGGVLLEILLAIGLFIGAGAFVLGASHNAIAALERSRKTLAALDLARSKLAELEAGLISLEELRVGEIDDVGSIELDDAGNSEPMQWQFDLKTQRTEFPGLTLVQLTVTEVSPAGTRGRSDESAASATLRQLMPLRDPDAEQYEVDDLIKDLPEEEEEAPETSRDADERGREDTEGF